MDILFVCSWFPSKLHPTAGNFIERHLEAVQQCGHRVFVLHLGISNRIIFPTIKHETGERRHVFHLLMPRWLNNSRRTWALALKILKRMNGVGFVPEVIHGHILYPAGDLAAALSKHTNSPLVYTEHWTAFNTANAPDLPREVLEMAKRVAASTSYIMPVSNDLMNSMQQLNIRSRYKVIYNAVDTNYFFPNGPPENKEFTFLHISNFLPQAKNVEGIIDAFELFCAKNALAARLIIAGDGDLERLVTYAKGKSCLKKITFKGMLNYKEVAAEMQNADCFVLFSNYENLPCVIAESLCCGTPVIATNVGGIPEMIDETNGILIEPKDSAALAGAMQTLLQGDVFDRMQISASAWKKYSYDTVGREFSDIYHAALQKK